MDTKLWSSTLRTNKNFVGRRFFRICFAHIGENISFSELLGDLLKTKPKDTDSIDSVIIVDNIPVVGADRLTKLQNVVKKIYEKFGKVVNDFYPMVDDKTKG